MKEKKQTKKALLMSVLSMVLCVAMLVGMTFAWFTDTASTAVNKIQAGNLDVALEMYDNAQNKWVSAEGKTLQFKTADGRTDNILWEPGCTYELPKLRVVNKGNLALKYKIAITGIQGSAKLNEAIKWTINNNADNSAIVTAATEQTLAEYKLLEANNAHELTIKGEMNKNAGNEYQGLSIDGISVTVYATQYTYEKDSNSDQHDKDAAYKGSQEFTSGTHVLSNGGIALATDARPVAVYATGNNTNVTITGGYYDGGSGGDYNIAVWANDNANVTIKDGYFTVGADKNGEANSVIYSTGGKITIEGGFFQTNYSWNDKYYVLNQQNNNPGTITVKGGTFVNYDPSKGDDNLGGNFVAEGYSVMKETKANGDVWYTVVKGKVADGQEEANNAITSATSGAATINLAKNTTITLDNDIANEGTKSRDITFVGDGTQTVDVVTNAVNAEGGQLNYQRGSSFTFENLTIQAGDGSFDGIVCDELIYKNCTIKGKLTLYGKATFIGCTFENDMANQYSIWTWGGTDVTFEKCKFNTNGKAILLYGKATEAKPTNLVVTNCEFNDRNNGSAGKAAIEIGNDYNATYTLTVKNATVSGFAEGKNTGSKLWANKNSMDAAHLSVTIDDTKVL